MKILVVDDQKELLKALVLGLESLGLAPAAASGGQAAYERMQQEFFDVVLCDVQMPGMGGVDLFLKLRNQPFQPGRFIFMSNAVPQPALLKELGLDEIFFLSKPFGFQSLKAALQMTE